MDQETYVKKFMLWTGVALAVLMFILHLIFFKMTEVNMLEEVSKRVFMSIGILAAYEAFAAFVFGPFFYRFFYERKHKK